MSRRGSSLPTWIVRSSFMARQARTGAGDAHKSRPTVLPFTPTLADLDADRLSRRRRASARSSPMPRTLYAALAGGASESEEPLGRYGADHQHDRSGWVVLCQDPARSSGQPKTRGHSQGPMTGWLRGLADAGRPGSAADRFRQRRRFAVPSTPGCPPAPGPDTRCRRDGELWESAGYAGSEGIDIVLLNLIEQESPYPNITTTIGDAADLSRYGDGAFDVAVSNSVIEHLPTPALQARMG